MLRRGAAVILLAGLSALLWLDATWAVPATAAPRASLDQFRPGMTAEEVRNVLREPQQLARQIYFRRYAEVWTYSAPPGQLVFQAELGQNPRIVNVHPSPPIRK